MTFGKPKLGNHDVFCINCNSVYSEKKINLVHAGRTEEGDFYNDKCPKCGASNSHVDVDGRSKEELLSELHGIARERHEQRKAQKRGNEKVPIDCVDCDTTFEIERRYEQQFDYDGNEPKCEDCRRQDNIEDLRKCLDPDHDGVFGRANALMRLKQEYGQMPIVDHDGSLITLIDVQYGRGIGGEPNGYWIEEIEEITNCDECDYERAKRHTKVNAGHHRSESFHCPKCGHSEQYQ